MYAIVDIAGQQFRVEKGQKIFVHRLANPEGEMIDFDQVLLIDNDGKISIGEPLVEGAFIEAKVITHLKGDKVIVFKKKRRKGYQKRNGHRQYLSQVEVLGINEKGATRKGAKAVITAEETEEVKATTAKTTAKESAPEAAPKAEKAAKATKPAAAKATRSAAKDATEKPKAAKATTAKATGEKKAASATTKKTTAKPKAAPKKDKPADSTEK